MVTAAIKSVRFKNVGEINRVFVKNARFFLVGGYPVPVGRIE